MAKFKVGDKVLIDVWPDKGLVGTVKEIDYGGHPGNVYVDYGTGAGSVPESQLRPANSRACNSTNPVVANAMRARNGNVVMNTMGDGMSDGKSRIDEAIHEMKYVMGFRLRPTAEDASKKAYAEVAGIAKNLIAQLQSIKREMERARRIADGQML